MWAELKREKHLFKWTYTLFKALYSILYYSLTEYTRTKEITEKLLCVTTLDSLFKF